jgi:hypothetical protein
MNDIFKIQTNATIWELVFVPELKGVDVALLVINAFDNIQTHPHSRLKDAGDR